MNKRIRIGINGFGRMGRLALRAAWDWPDIEFVRINDPAMDAATAAHLLEFDSVHGRWSRTIHHDDEAIVIDNHRISFSSNAVISETAWDDCDVVLECSGKFRTRALLEPFLQAGVSRVVVSAPVKEADVPNIVVGVNDAQFDPGKHAIVSAASCTTNCLAPMVKVMQETVGIRHGVITTIHDATNTQRVLDGAHKDLRRARSMNQSLIPTSTGSAKAITVIFPELEGKLNGIAVRVPLFNASITDAVFEVERNTDIDEINAAFKAAAENELRGIFGYEERPLVSVDFRSDPRSGILDALSTMVVDKRQVKLLVWYDNEYGYVHRMMELARRAGSAA
jgi:glyceraldehyde 3-phosphate dehydrogenase